MVIVSPHRALLAAFIFLVAAPAALADPPASSKARKHRPPAIVLQNAPEPGASFLSSAPRSYWKQFDSRRIGP